MLTKGKFHTYYISAVSDVTVTSCSAILGKKQGFAGIAVTRSFLKIDNRKRLVHSEWATKLPSRMFEILKSLEI